MMTQAERECSKVIGLVDLCFTNKRVPIQKVPDTLIKCIADTGEVLYTWVSPSSAGPVGCHPLNVLIHSR